jgi:hypothetical protein
LSQLPEAALRSLRGNCHRRSTMKKKVLMRKERKLENTLRVLIGKKRSVLHVVQNSGDIADPQLLSELSYLENLLDASDTQH